MDVGVRGKTVFFAQLVGRIQFNSSNLEELGITYG